MVKKAKQSGIVVKTTVSKKDEDKKEEGGKTSPASASVVQGTKSKTIVKAPKITQGENVKKAENSPSKDPPPAAKSWKDIFNQQRATPKKEEQKKKDKVEGEEEEPVSEFVKFDPDDPAVPYVINDDDPFKMNREMIIGLEKLQKKFEIEKDQIRAKGYRNGAAQLKAINKPFECEKDFKGIPGVGKGIMKKVKEYLLWGRFRRIENPKGYSDEDMVQIDELANIWSVGASKAVELHQKGFTSIEKLRRGGAASIALTEMQQIGLRYFEDLKAKMTREEATNIAQTVKDACKAVFPDLDISAEAVGSYRRGKQECGDVDVLITNNETKSTNLKEEIEMIQQILPGIVEKLEESKFLVERLGKDKVSTSGSVTYMGICLHPTSTVNRRIDLKVYPKSQYGYAILYFTGSRMFNTNMRIKALLYGYCLSDSSLKLMMVNKGKVWGTKDEKIQASLEGLLMQSEPATERDILTAFGMEWIEPCNRIS